MTSLTNWLSPSAMHSLGWTLLHFLWQGTAVAALAAVLMTLCRRASTRYTLAVGALALMLAAPVATFFFLSSSCAPVPAKPSAGETQPASANNIVIVARTSAAVSRLSPSRDALPWLVEAWLLGVAFFSLRSAGGFLLLERERRKQSITASARVLAICQTLQRRLGLKRAIHYGECTWLQAPAVLGWFRPIVLLPVTALTGLSEEQLQLVIVHELAHIQRLDPFVNVFQISVETLLFYHPAVWWLNQRIRAEREHCCDDVAVSLCGNPVEYARALTLMEEWRTAPALAMAANRGPLSERIFRVLGLKPMGAGTRGIGLTGGVLCLTAALIAGNALLEIAYPKPVVHAGQISLAGLGWRAAANPQSSPGPASTATPAAKPSPVRPAVASQPAASGSYIDGMKAAGLDNLTVDQLIAMKIQGISPEYVRGLKEAGLQPNIDQLIAMKIQGVTPDYVRSLHEQDLQPDVDNLVAMRIQGVTPDYVRDIQALGLKPSIDQFIAMRIQGVTAEYIKSLQAAGFKVDIDDAIRAKIQGISREFIERAVKQGFQNLTLEKLIQLKEMGVMESATDI
jgi:beta-lactamase regulating signal transducer with metallopeptidase domain